VVDPSAGTDGEMDILVENGRIKDLGERLHAPGSEVLDLSGLIVVPGLIDMHVHLREPGSEDAETIQSGMEAAAAGGLTAVAAMPNTSPVNDDRSVTEFVLQQAARYGTVRVHPIGCVTRGLEGENLAQIGDLVQAGCVAVSDDGRPIRSALVMRRALEYCRVMGIPVIDHCEEPSLATGGVMNEGTVSTALGLPGIPAESEELMVERDIRLARLTGGTVHIAHISTARSIESVKRGKARGIAVTAEVTPHHLLLTHEELRGYETCYRMNPPLRSEADRDACVAALAAGVIDCIATDHAPHPREEKNVEFAAAPNGVVGLETAVPVLLDRLVLPGRLSLARFAEAFSCSPAKILGLKGQGSLKPGSAADVTVLDLNRLVTVDAARFRSLSRNTPFQGWRCRGRAVLTLVAGRIRFDERG
ncbi:MAG: dihydroorotase, partial [Acidobacteriota bacterium]